VVGGLLGLRDAGVGMSAVQGFNRALMESGLVRQYARERATQGSISHGDRKREYLRHIVDKRGIQHFSQLAGGQQRTNLIAKDVVMFPYTFDYL
jgi:hypothetical protein